MRRAWILFVFSACGGAHSGAGNSSPPPPWPTGAESTVTGTLEVQPATQCGGAVPPPDYVPPGPAPAPGATLFIVPGDVYRGEAGARKVTTDGNGAFTVNLAAGRYCITRAGRGERPAKVGEHYDLKCLVGLWERCDAVVDVPAAKPVAIHVDEACAGLSCYDGPPPP